MVHYNLGDLYIFDDTVALIGTEARAINVELEAEAIYCLNRSRLKVIELIHSLDLTEDNGISILV